MGLEESEGEETRVLAAFGMKGGFQRLEQSKLLETSASQIAGLSIVNP